MVVLYYVSKWALSFGLSTGVLISLGIMAALMGLVLWLERKFPPITAAEEQERREATPTVWPPLNQGPPSAG